MLGATGDAIAMVEPLNADLINTQLHSMILPSGLGQYCNPGVGSAYGLGSAYLVNQDGVRFTNEQGNAWDLMQAMKENERQYLVMDQASFDAFNQAMINSAIYTQDDVTTWLANDGQGNPFMVSAESMEALAEKLDVPSDALVETMNQYNMDAANGSDS